jgi:hypothetical protein
MKCIRYFILSAGTLLAVAGLVRFLVVFKGAQVLALPEPMLGVPLRYVVMLVGVIELATAWFCLFGKRSGLQITCVTWLAVNYALYRIGAIAVGGHHQATAIGSLTDPLHLTGGFLGLLGEMSPVILLVGGIASTIWLSLAGPSSNRQKIIERSIKMSCPGCGTHILFDRSFLGKTIPCTQCKATVVLRSPEDKLKISCYFCHEHIEFPAHAVGDKLKCPHCNHDITLKEPDEATTAGQLRLHNPTTP